MELLDNGDTLYSSLEMLLRPKLRQYKMTYTPSMTEFMTATVVWLYGVVKDISLQKELAETRQVTDDIIARAIVLETNVKVL